MDLSPAPQDQFEQWELDLIEQEAKVFSGRYRLRLNRVDDLAAEGLTAWWLQRPNYDPKRGASKPTFLKVVVRNAFADVAKKERAQKRTAEVLAYSFDAPIGPGSQLTLGDITRGSDDFGDLAFVMDVRAVLERMPPRQRAVIRGRLAGERTTTLAKRLGVHRDTLYQDIKEIQRVFRTANLVLPDPTDRPAASHRAGGGRS